MGESTTKRDGTDRGSTRRAAVASTAGAAALLAGAWVIQLRGYVPCELCLVDRVPLYAALPLGIAAATLRGKGARAALVATALALALGTALGAYHAGVEAHLWAGPSACAGVVGMPGSAAGLAAAMSAARVVRCDVPAMVVLGLSLAAWDALACAALASVAGLGAAASGRGREGGGGGFGLRWERQATPTKMDEEEDMANG